MLYIKSSNLRMTGLRFFSWFRKIYSPVIFWILWIFSIRRMLSRDRRSRLKSYYSMIKRLLPREFEKELREVRKLKWKSEKLGGLVDFTYVHPWICFDEAVTDKWGRDCDDLANLWYKYFRDRGAEEVYIIMCVSEDVSTAHMFTVIREDRMVPDFKVYDNMRDTAVVEGRSTKGLNVYEVVNTYLSERDARLLAGPDSKRYRNTVWTFYRRHTNF